MGKWITSEHVDRIACPSLIKKCIDPKAEFIFVPPQNILDVAKKDEIDRLERFELTRKLMSSYKA